MFAIEDIQQNTSRDLDEVQRIQLIAGRFPCLKYLPCVQQWNANALAKWAKTASHGERCAAQFVLSVWNCFDKPVCGRFDVIEAFNVWDQSNKDAFLAWALNPVNC